MDEQPDPARLLSLRETIGLVGISRSTAYRLLENGDFPKPVKIGSRNFFSSRELQSWIQEKLAGRQPSARHDK
jgi:prophage regulatory protein